MGNRLKAVWDFISSPNYSRTLTILGIFTLLTAIPLTVYVVQQQQEIRQRAQTTEVLHPIGEILDVSPASGNAGQQFTVRGEVTATTTDPSNPSYIINKMELWVTKRGTPDQAPQNCPGPVSGIWCRIGFYEGESQFNAFVTGAWTAPEPGNYLFVINGFVKSGGRCSGNPVLPDGWEACGRTGRRALVEIAVGAGQPPAPPTATPTLTPTPTQTPTTLCSIQCPKLTPQSKRNVTDCDFADQYMKVDKEGDTCNASCAQIPSGNRRKADGCGFEPIPGSQPPSGGNSSQPAPQPPAPTSPSQPAPGGTKLTATLILPESKTDKQLIVQVFDEKDQMVAERSATIRNTGGGNYTATVDIGNPASGTYKVKIKATKYLRKLLPDIPLQPGADYRLPQTILVLGDINNDNELNALDYAVLVDCFGAKADTSSCGSNKAFADLNDDGKVDGVDYNLFVRNLKEKRQGD